MITYSLQVAYKFPVTAFSNPSRTPLKLGYRSALEIKKAVAVVFGISIADLEGSTRAAPVALARFAAYHLIRAQGRFSTTGVGRFMGGRDHSTVIHGLRRCEELLATDPEFAARYEEARG